MACCSMNRRNLACCGAASFALFLLGVLVAALRGVMLEDIFKAFLVIPLVGAFFVDILNALIIKFFLGLPMMQKTTALVGV